MCDFFLLWFAQILYRTDRMDQKNKSSSASKNNILVKKRRRAAWCMLYALPYLFSVCNVDSVFPSSLWKIERQRKAEREAGRQKKSDNRTLSQGLGLSVDRSWCRYTGLTQLRLGSGYSDPLRPGWRRLLWRFWCCYALVTGVRIILTGVKATHSSLV
jgi:hypothetical protein